MRHAIPAILAVALLHSGPSLEGADHATGTHAQAETHRHGDSDDRHDSPDSPCRHHAQHCCCTHVPVAAAGAASSAAPPLRLLAVARIDRSLRFELIADSLFRPPKA